MGLVLFRVDGSHSLGMGHIVRCIAFADGLKRKGISCLFLIKNYDDRVANLISKRGFNVEAIPTDLSLS
ncbi:MAG: hypothetical protein ACE5H1_02520, partial [Thermodesulfobacteriota bacterium]